MTGRPPAPTASTEVPTVAAGAVARELAGDGELALIDVREPGEHARGHPFFAVPIPFGRFEPELLRLLPNSAARVVLLDEDGSDRAARAATLARGLGYDNVAILEQGARGWSAAGLELFEGENVPSKTFGEAVEVARAVPHVDAASLAARRERGERILLLDGRPLAEHRRMCIPGALCLPNGDLAERIRLAVADESMPIVVHCAGRTRSIIGAETLRMLGLRNPVAALENGTQGWTLAGLPLERGSDRLFARRPDAKERPALRARAAELARKWGVPRPDVDTVRSWIRDRSRTTYLLDVRGPDEHAAAPVAGVASAPGGQLLQATERWLAVRGGRVVLIDDTEIRAVVTACWLRQMGWDAMALAGGDAAWPALAALAQTPAFRANPVPPIAPAAVAAEGHLPIVDLRSSAAFRDGHLRGARWSSRALLPAHLGGVRPGRLVLVAEDHLVAALAAGDVRALGFDPFWLPGDPRAWAAVGLAIDRTPEDPPDAARIDFVAFMHDRHSGNPEAARGYLAWEKGLLARLSPEERRSFRIAPA